MPSLWHRHPAVRSGDQLTVGERAADRMRDSFGSWSFIGATMLFIGVWIVMVLYAGITIDNHQLTILNLILSCFAAMQGAIILLAAKRADAISGEIAVHTVRNTDDTKTLLEANTDLTRQVHELATTIAAQTCTLDELHRHLEALTPQAGQFTPPPAVSPPPAPRSSRKRT